MTPSTDWQLAVLLAAYAFLVWALLPRRSERSERVTTVCPCVHGTPCGEHARSYAEMKRDAPLVNRERN